MSSINLRVIAPVPAEFFHCLHCEQFFMRAGIGQQVRRSQLEEYPENFIRDTARLAEWIDDLIQRYRNHLRIQVYDPQSLQGFFLSLRYRVRTYPTFIVAGRKAYAGWNRNRLDILLQESLSEQSDQ